MHKKSPTIVLIICSVLSVSLMLLLQVVSAEDELAPPPDLGSSPTEESIIYRCPIRGQIVFYEAPDTSSRRLLAYIGQLNIYIIGQDESGEWLRVAYYNRQQLVTAWAQARFVDLCLPEGESLAIVDMNNPPEVAMSDYDTDSDVNANVETGNEDTPVSASTATHTAIPGVITSTPTSSQGTLQTPSPSFTPSKMPNTATLAQPTDTPTSSQGQFSPTPDWTDTPIPPTDTPTDTPTSSQGQFTPTLPPTDTPIPPTDTPTDTPTSSQGQFTPTPITPTNTPTYTPTSSSGTFVAP